MPGKLYLEDLHVGQIFRSDSYTIDASKIKEFAHEYDPQVFHLDESEAEQSFFEGLAGSGWHTASITMRLLVQSFPISGGLIGTGADVTWTRPTRPGDSLTVETEIMEINPSRKRPDRGMVTIRSVTKNQTGKTVQMMTSKLVAPRRPV